MMAALATTMPGDRVTGLIEGKLEEREALKSNSLLAKRSGGPDESLPTVKLGNGLLQMDDQIVAIQAGHLHFAAPNRFWIASHRKRYVPAVGDLVLGVVTAKLSELYRVDLGCHMNASLPLTGFEGATKKNKPVLEVGSLVFARVLVANKDMEPELVCFDTNNKAEGFGEVKPSGTGLLTRCSCTWSQSLQRAVCPILDAIAKHLPFELIAGANGRFVVQGSGVRETVAITEAILQAETCGPDQHRSIIKDMMNYVQSSS